MAEGWHNAFASMTGIKRPTIFRFIDELKKDEDISRLKIISCQAGRSPPAKKPKVIQRNRALKNAVLQYQERIEAEKVKQTEQANKTDDSDDEDDIQEEDNGIQELRGNSEREDWLKGPEFVLLKAVAHNL